MPSSKKERNAYGNALAERLDKKEDAKNVEKIRQALSEVAALSSDPAKPDAPTFGALIEQGKLPVKLGMDWDGRVSFVLTEGLQLRKLAFLDGVFEDNASAEDEGGFDADVAIATGELASLLTDLIAALGGELAPDTAAAPPANTLSRP